MMVRKLVKKLSACVLAAAVVAGLTGCGSVTSGKRIVRISHAQSETHPEHLGLLAFKEYVEERLGDKYEVQIFPNELLGSAQKAIELTQTGAIDFVVAGTANLETFAGVYEIFSMPYLFESEEVYKSVMEDSEYMENVYESTDEAGFRVVTWYNAGTRNFYAKTPIYTPEDLAGKKVAVKIGTEGQTFAESIKDEYGFTTVVFDDSNSMYLDVKSGNSVACFEDYPVMGYAISQGSGLKMVTEKEQGSSYGFAVNKGENAELLEMFNAGLANLKESGKYDEILNTYIQE